ncbi:MAG: hypothetical protein ABI479_04395 [Gallionella sp.]
MPTFARKYIRLSPLPSGLMLGVALAFPLQLLAAEQPDQPTSPILFDVVDAPRDYLAEKFVSFAADIDRFFGDNRNYQESNKSVLQIDLSRVAGYGGGRNFVLSGRAKLHLPTTEQRLHLLLETDPEKNVTGESTQGQPVVFNQVVAPGKVSLAARYQKAEETRWHFSTDAGIQIRSPLQPFARARGSYSIPMEQWRMKVAESVFWFNTIGAGESTQLDLEHPFSEPVLFRASSNATWLHDKQNFDLRQDLSIYHTLNERSALLYQASAIGVSRPQGQVTDYVALMLYRYRLHRDWVFLELSPQLHFPKERNYRSSPMFSMRLEMLFDETK